MRKTLALSLAFISMGVMSMSHAAETGTAKGTLVVAGKTWPLDNVIAWRPLGGGYRGTPELWVYVADGPITADMARDAFGTQIREQVAAGKLHGVKLKIAFEGKQPNDQEIAGDVYASGHPGGQFSGSGGEAWETLTVNGQHVAAKARYESKGNEFLETPGWSL
jgi:hypothetical protein